MALLSLVVAFVKDDEGCEAIGEVGALQGVLDLLLRAQRDRVRTLSAMKGLAARFLRNLVRHDPVNLSLFTEHPAVAGQDWQSWLPRSETA
eukprot:1288731-Pleurochrysis_carterae.AAC.1